ncbi:MAG: protein translocase subunit SecF, partial [Eubacterium sp.]
MKKTLKIVEKSKIWFAIAIALVLISVGSLVIRGLNFGIDFVGGTIVTIDLHTQFETSDARQIVDKYDKNAEITYAGDNKDQIVISTKESLDTDQREALFNQFKEKYKLEDKDLISVDTISATIGSETARNAIIASLVAMGLMLIYITIRFEFLFGLSAIIALFYDII